MPLRTIPESQSHRDGGFRQGRFRAEATTFPRTKGMTQKEQRLLQPSWILRMDECDSFPAETGATRTSRTSKISPIKSAGVGAQFVALLARNVNEIALMLSDEIRNLRFVGIANDEGDSRKGGDFFGARWRSSR